MDVPRDYFLYPLRVGAEAIDLNGHANNVEFVRWMQEAAMAHSAACGWPLARYAATGCSWVVRAHHIEYLRPARLGEDLVLATWIASFDSPRSPRRTLFWRPRDRKLLARAETHWVFVEVASGRAQDIPADFVSAFDLGADERSVLQALRRGTPAVG